MECEACHTTTGRQVYRGGVWGCAACIETRVPVVQAPWFQERIVKCEGFGWVTRAQRDEWDRTSYRERTVDRNPTTGQTKVNLHPISERAFKQKAFFMGAGR